MQAAGCNVICVDVADEGIGRVIGELLLEERIEFLPDGRVGGLARLGQIFVNFLVRVAGVVRALVGAEDFVGVVVRIEGAAPADQARLLSAPVHLGRDIDGAVDAGVPELLRGGLRDIDAVLFAGHDADDKADFLAVPLVVAVRAHRAAGRFQNGLCLFGVIVVVLDVFIIIDVPLQGAVGRHALPQKHRIHDGLPVDRIADGGDDVFIFAPVVVPEVKENAAVVAGFEIVAGKAVFSLELLGIFGVEERKVQLAGLQLHGLRIVVGDDLEDDAVDVCRALKIALVFLKNNRLTDVPAGKLICACADRIAEEVGGLEVFALE